MGDGGLGHRAAEAGRRSAEAAVERTEAVVGGPARLRVIVILACVLALDSADKGALSATAGAVEHYFGISKTALGLLGSVSTGVAAVATLPFGIWVDRARRTRLLVWGIAIWAVAMVVSGTATDYYYLLAARVFLGIVTGVAYPAVASLIGDYFPQSERARVYGWVLSGELIGTGVGVLIAGGAASVFGSWRAAEFTLAAPALALAWWMWRFPEPARGGASQMPRGQERLLSARAVAGGAQPEAPAGEGRSDEEEDPVRRLTRARHVEPDDSLVLRRDPDRLRIWSAVRYVLRIRTNVVVIVASALGYFFLTGVRYFGILYVEGHYHLSRTAASFLLLVIGAFAVLGVIVGGRVTDILLRRGRLSARIAVPIVTFAVSAVLFAPAIWTTSIAVAVILFVAAAFFFGGSNPALDAARLDIMVPRLWGRAEATRTVFRGTLEALAPVTFGLVADNLFGNHGAGGLEGTFELMLLPLLVAAAVLVIALRTYQRDVATAEASGEALDRQRRGEPVEPGPTDDVWAEPDRPPAGRDGRGRAGRSGHESPGDGAYPGSERSGDLERSGSLPEETAGPDRGGGSGAGGTPERR